MARKRPAQTQKTMDNLVNEISATSVTLKSNWERYSMEGVKKGAKEARKAALTLKKLAVEFRRQFKELGL